MSGQVVQVQPETAESKKDRGCSQDGGGCGGGDVSLKLGRHTHSHC